MGTRGKKPDGEVDRKLLYPPPPSQTVTSCIQPAWFSHKIRRLINKEFARNFFITRARQSHKKCVLCFSEYDHAWLLASCSMWYNFTFLVEGATHGFRRMGEREALQHKASMALSAPSGQTLLGAVCPRPIYSYSPCVKLQVQTLVDFTDRRVRAKVHD